MTMNCEIARNKLLAAADAQAPPSEAAAHIAACPGCQQYVARYEQLALQLQALPAPESMAKDSFLLSLLHDGPVIRNMPSVPVRSSGFARLFRRAVLVPAAGIAAAVALAFGIFQHSGTKSVTPEATAPRHELLAKLVKLDADLAKAKTPQQRLPKLAEMAEALCEEAKGIQLAAVKKDELRVLERSFEKVVKDGMVKQANAFAPFTPPSERNAVLNAAAERLAAAAAEAEAAESAAPPQAKESFAGMAKAAKQARADVLKQLS
jgi:hypothetical protein